MTAPRRGPAPSRVDVARSVALRVLRLVESKQGFSNRTLAEVLDRHPELADRDRGLITHLVYGVLRHRTRLDHLIDAFAHRPDRLRGEMREILRILAFELCELERPVAIAIAEATRLSRRLDPTGRLGRMMHAILAGIDRDRAILDATLEHAEPVHALERRWSIPGFLAKRWVEHLGPERALARAQALANVPATDLRVDLSRSSVADAIAELSRGLPNARFSALPLAGAVRAESAGDLSCTPWFEDGLVSIQGLGSQRAAHLLAPAPGERILDACAGMGTKSLQLAELMHRRGTLVVADADERRLGELSTAAVRGRLEGGDLRLTILHADLAEDVPALAQMPAFDAILLDAPCTGFGTLGRHPELRWRADPSSIAERSALQSRLLGRLLERLAPGGRLVYAVCTLEPEEGPEVIQRICAERSDVRLVREETSTPEDDGTDGFYSARLELA